jgi:hypothetical protein
MEQGAKTVIRGRQRIGWLVSMSFIELILQSVFAPIGAHPLASILMEAMERK